MQEVFGIKSEGGGFCEPGRAVWWTSTALLLVALTIPVFAAEVPPLTDYPNHLARCYVLAFGNTDPVLSRMFSAHWQIIPNIAIDLLLPALMQVFSPFTAGRIVLALCLLLPTSGTIALSYALFQRRSFWQLTAGFAAFNVLFLMGFMNFCLGIGVALWGVAAWIHFRERAPWLAVGIAVVLATPTFFFHMMGLFFYALLVACYEVLAIWDEGIRTATQRLKALKRIAMAGIPLVVPIFLYLRSPLESTGGEVAWTSYRRKAYSLLIPFLDYSLAIDLLIIAPVLGFLVYCLYTKKAWISRPMALCSCILIGGYAILPQTMKGVFWVDSRMMAMLGFVAFAGFLPKGLTVRQQTMLASAIAVLFLIKVGFIANVWRNSQRDVRSVREVIAQVEPGSLVLEADVTKEENPAWFASMPLGRNISLLNPTYWHLAAFVLLDRHAFWPTIFAVDSQQPIRVLYPYRASLGAGAAPPDYHFLDARQLSTEEKQRFPFIADWTNRFDYLLLLNAEGAGDLDRFLPDKLELVDRKGVAALFRVRQSGAGLRAAVR